MKKPARLGMTLNEQSSRFDDIELAQLQQFEQELVNAKEMPTVATTDKDSASIHDVKTLATTNQTNDVTALTGKRGTNTLLNQNSSMMLHEAKHMQLQSPMTLHGDNN